MAEDAASTASKLPFLQINKRIQKLTDKEFNAIFVDMIAKMHEKRNMIVHENADTLVSKSDFDGFILATLYYIRYLNTCAFDKKFTGAVDDDTMLEQLATLAESD